MDQSPAAAAQRLAFKKRALISAVTTGDTEAVADLLDGGIPIDTKDDEGMSLLHLAAQGGHVTTMRLLIRRGCDVDSVDSRGLTPLHCALHVVTGKTEAVRELIKLGAARSVVAGRYGTPLHQAVSLGHMETAEALLEDETPESCVVSTCNSVGETPVMWAVRKGQLEMLKLLISKGGAISNRDAHSLSAFEHSFISGQASKLKQFCEACGIRSSGEGLRGALTTLITQGLVDAHKVLCLCAISGDSVFLTDQFCELVISDACVMPAAVKCVEYRFCKSKSSSFLNKLRIPNDNALNPLQMALLSLKCYKMGFAIGSVQHGTKDHTAFITKLLSHPVLKETVHEHFPNGLSPLDLARQFELHHIAALIEVAGGRPGVWAGVPPEIEVRHPLALLRVKEAYACIKGIAEDGELGLECIKGVFSSILGSQTVESVVQAADDSRLVKEQVFSQRPDLGDVVTHVLPHIQVRCKWKSIGVCLGIEKSTLNQFSNDDDPYLETLSYWLEHGRSVTWKTLFDVLGHFETKHTVDELTDKIVSVLGEGHQVSVWVLCVE